MSTTTLESYFQYQLWLWSRKDEENQAGRPTKDPVTCTTPWKSLYTHIPPTTSCSHMHRSVLNTHTPWPIEPTDILLWSDILRFTLTCNISQSKTKRVLRWQNSNQIFRGKQLQIYIMAFMRGKPPNKLLHTWKIGMAFIWPNETSTTIVKNGKRRIPCGGKAKLQT